MYFLYVEFSDFYVNQSLAGRTIIISVLNRIGGNELLKFLANDLEGLFTLCH
jgi:hypothetical protein